MPRQVRIEYAGAFYHVVARGNRREPIVFDDRDRKTDPVATARVEDFYEDPQPGRQASLSYM